MPLTPKTFRVFVSSTFTDMREERHILQREVFPRLKSLCESKGASFQDVDLRWGVNEEAQLDQKIMNLCLGEIARCQRLSPKPNFIILLGDKYGWQPIPERIPNPEMELMLRELFPDDKSFITSWYREDRNAVPPEYVLQPRGEGFHRYEDWQKIENALQSILRSAVNRLALSADQNIKYFASATHQEIIRGAMEPTPGAMEPGEHVFAYFRHIKGLPGDATAKDYLNLSGRIRDPYAKAQLDALKGALNKKLPGGHIYPYNATWANGCTIDNAKALGDRVYEDLKSAIEGQLQNIENADSLTTEKKLHREFKDHRLEHFIGRKDALKAIAGYLDSPSQKVFSVIGASGTGKTSLLAKAFDTVSNKEGAKILRFLGTTSTTSDAYRFLSNLTEEIASEYNRDKLSLLKNGENETKLSTLIGLQELLPRLLNLATKEKPLIIFLDALDQLSREIAEIPLDWIPKELPEHVKFIVSAFPDLKERLMDTILYDLSPMPATEGEELLNIWLTAINRTLTYEQMRLVINKFTENGTPMYLRLAFEKAKAWHSYDSEISLKPDSGGILDEYFDAVEKEHSPLLLSKVCGYILSGKYQGLAENELLDLLVSDKEYWLYFLEHCHPDHRREVEELNRLPVIIWSRLFLDLEPYLTTRDADGLPIISFYHRRFIDYLKSRYIENPISFHFSLADYFENTAIYLDKKEQKPNIRKVVEQPFQETLSKRWLELANKTLGAFPFLMAKTKADMLEGILEDYAILWEKAPETLKNRLDRWRSFFTERAHILRRGKNEWPACKIFFQLAIEHADDSPLTKGAEQYLEDDKVDWIYLRRIQRLKEAGIKPYLAVLEGHTKAVLSAIQLKNGGILSWSEDRTLRTWDVGGRPLSVLEGHKGFVEGAIQLKDGRILSWANDNILRIWNVDGRPLGFLEGHTNYIYGAIQLNDGRILSWSKDNTLRIWDANGRPLAVLEGHEGPVEGAIQLNHGRILSWAKDNALLRIWDVDGRPIAVLEGHEGPVVGAIQLNNGQMLSWSKDETLRIWDDNGCPLAVLEGHSSWVSGAISLNNGRILSWSMDNTLRIWDDNGRPLAVLEGHTWLVNNAIQIQDGRILSWADTTLRIWNADGRSLAVLEGHTLAVYSAIQLHDGRILSCSCDKTMRIWDPNGRPLGVLEGHSGWIIGAIQLHDGRILSWAGSGDKTLRIWDSEIRPLSVLESHEDWVFGGVIQLNDKRILSWASDKTPRIWDSNGHTIAVLEGHTDYVKGVIPLNNGRILSWANDNTLRIWDPNGLTIAVLEGQDYVTGAIQLKEGRILTWNSGNPPRIWDSDGLPLGFLEGHTRSIDGIIQLNNGRMLSWSNDYILRIWDVDGRPIAVLEGHTWQINSAIQLNDGRILSWSNDYILRIWDVDGRPIAVLEAQDYVEGAVQLHDGQILTWTSDKTLYMWDSKTGVCLEKLTFTEFCLKYPESIPLYIGKDLCDSGFYAGTENCYGEVHLPIKDSKIILYARWHAESDCTARFLKPNGTFILTQANGQVCFLKIYSGKKPISIAELEEIHGIMKQGNSDPSTGK
jgi:WD40 repeat protein